MKLITLLLLSVTSYAQVGTYISVGSETVYSKNLFVSGGVEYKRIAIGGFYQRFEHTEVMLPYQEWRRYGIYTSVNLLNVDSIFFLNLDCRTFLTNNHYVNFQPSVSFLWRFGPRVYIQNLFSLHSNWPTGAIIVGLRIPGKRK